MMTIEHVTELKEKLAILKEYLRQSLHDVTVIDNFNLGSKEVLSYDEIVRVRKKLAHLKLRTSNKFNNVLFLLEPYLNKDNYLI